MPGSVNPGIPLVDRSQQACAECGSNYEDILDVPYFQRYIPVVIVGKCERHGVFHKRVNEQDVSLVHEAERKFADTTTLDPSEFTVPEGPKSKDLISRKVRSYLDLFSRRQLFFIEQAIKLIRTESEEHRLWLSLMISTSLEFNSLLCGYKGAAVRRPGAIRHVFSHHAYSFPYTALENNPVFHLNTSGTLGRVFRDRVEKAGRWASAPVERRIYQDKVSLVPVPSEVDGGEPVSSPQNLTEGPRRFYVVQADFQTYDMPAGSVDYVVTDPPYYDSVQYSDLSMFFRVWLRQLLPDKADWAYDPSTTAVASGTSEAKAYGEALASIWEKCRDALRSPHGRLIFTFHHWSPDAWSELTLSLKRSGFVLRNRYVIFSENPISVHIRNLKALKHDCILVLAPSSFHLDSREWQLPSQIDSDDSRQFCMDCGTALGFFLASSISEVAIRQAWRDLVRVNDNGKGTCRSFRLLDGR